VSNEPMITLSDIDKLDDTYSFRLPEITKKQVDKLSPPFKKKLNLKMLLVIAEVLHEAEFDPRDYLSTKESQ
jgi:hypothetical protein